MVSTKCLCNGQAHTLPSHLFSFFLFFFQEFWDCKNFKSLSKVQVRLTASLLYSGFNNLVQASDSTAFEWSPDGVHVVTATTAPRLREGNG